MVWCMFVLTFDRYVLLHPFGVSDAGFYDLLEAQVLTLGRDALMVLISDDVFPILDALVVCVGGGMTLSPVVSFQLQILESSLEVVLEQPEFLDLLLGRLSLPLLVSRGLGCLPD